MPRYLKLSALLCQFRPEPFTKLWLQSQSQSNLESRSINKVQYGGWTSRVHAGCFLLLASSITCPEINLSEDGETVAWGNPVIEAFDVFYLFYLASAQLLLVTDFFSGFWWWVCHAFLNYYRESQVYMTCNSFFEEARNAARLFPQRVNTKRTGWGSFSDTFSMKVVTQKRRNLKTHCSVFSSMLLRPRSSRLDTRRRPTRKGFEWRWSHFRIGKLTKRRFSFKMCLPFIILFLFFFKTNGYTLSVPNKTQTIPYINGTFRLKLS